MGRDSRAKVLVSHPQFGVSSETQLEWRKWSWMPSLWVGAGRNGRTWGQIDTREGAERRELNVNLRSASWPVINNPFKRFSTAMFFIITILSSQPSVLLRPGRIPLNKKNKCKKYRCNDHQVGGGLRWLSSVSSSRNTEISLRWSNAPGFSLTSVVICISQVNEISIFMAFQWLPLTLGSSGTGGAGDTDVNYELHCPQREWSQSLHCVITESF